MDFYRLKIVNFGTYLKQTLVLLRLQILANWIEIRHWFKVKQIVQAELGSLSSNLNIDNELIQHSKVSSDIYCRNLDLSFKIILELILVIKFTI